MLCVRGKLSANEGPTCRSDRKRFSALLLIQEMLLASGEWGSEWVPGEVIQHLALNPL